MSEINFKSIEAWCGDAVALLQAAGLPSDFADRCRDNIKAHAGSIALYEIAEDFAEGLNDLPPEAGKIAQEFLTKAYGFGFDLFTVAKMKRVKAVLKRGHIKSEDEYRDLLDIASDTTKSDTIRATITQILAAHEERLSSPKNPRRKEKQGSD